MGGTWPELAGAVVDRRRRHSAGRLSRRLAASIALLAIAGLAGCPGRTRVDPPPPGTPRLVLFVVVDQLGAELLERAQPLLAADGGLRRMLAEGRVFTAAHHGHAMTYTAPGHAALATGTHPRTSGVVANDWFDRDREAEVSCVEDDAGVVGPGRMLVPSIGDWLKARYPRSRVFAASGKDRGAVLIAGHGGDGAYWYDDDTGDFETSATYGAPPAWLGRFNDDGWEREVFTATTWEPLPVDPVAAAAAGFRPFDRGPFDHGLPRALGGFDWWPGEGFWTALYRSPLLDEATVRLARTLIEEEELGGDEWPDLLGLSFSSLDSVGHLYGPHSLEVLDVLLRLDRSLGELFALLDARLGRDGWMAGLSADHGVAPVPEVAAGGPTSRRPTFDELRCLRRATARVAQRFAGRVWLADDGYLDRRGLLARRHDPGAVEAAAEAGIAGCPGVDEVWTRSEIAAVRIAERPQPGAPRWLPFLYRNTFHRERSPDLLVELTPELLPVVGSHTTHVGPHPHDTHVPFVLLAPGLAAGTDDRPTLTVDFAPSLAALLDVPTPAPLDGRSRVRRSPTPR